MTNSVELQVICKILTSQDDSEIDRLCAFDESYYAVFKDQIKFILNHREKYHTVPDLFTFQAQFEDIVLIDVNESADFLVDGLRKNKQQILLLQTFNKLSELGSADVSEAWEFLQSQCDKAAQLDNSNPMDIIKEAHKRSDQVLSLSNQTRIPTGFKEVDETMYGGLSTVEELCLVVARTNTGKAQPLWSNILTPNGWKRMRDIQVGDIVCGRNNDNGKVVQIFPQGTIDYYRVKFDDGTYTECSADHLWEVLDSERRKHDRKTYGQYLTLTTRDIRNHMYRRYSVDMCDQIEFESDFDTDSELDGYFLGAFIGHGRNVGNKLYIHSLSDVSKRRIVDALSKYHCQFTENDPNTLVIDDRSDGKLIRKLLEYNLMNCKVIDRRIPAIYFHSPVNVRKALLSGLCDTDSAMVPTNHRGWVFVTSSDQLKSDFVYIARSLGVKAKVMPSRSGRWVDAGVSHVANTYHRVMCSSKFNPFYGSPNYTEFERRQDKTKFKNLKRVCKFIDSIEYVGKTECQCIMVDNKTHTYITDDFIVTHNTWVTTKMMESAQANGFPVLYYSPEMQSAFIGTRFDTWRGHFRNSDIQRGKYSEDYIQYIKDIVKEETGAFVAEDKDMPGGKTTVRSIETLVKRHHIKLVIIDGLSYMADTEKSDSDVIKYKNICTGLFRMSKTYGCAVVVSVQANRDTKSNVDDKGVPWPDMYSIEGSDHPGRIATQVFALRQLYEEHTLEIKLLKTRNAKNANPTFAYVWDPNTGNTEFVSDDASAAPPSAPAQPSKFSTPTVSAKIVHTDIDDNLIDGSTDDDLDDVEF